MQICSLFWENTLISLLLIDISGEYPFFLENPEIVTYTKCFRPRILFLNIHVCIYRYTHTHILGGHSCPPAKFIIFLLSATFFNPHYKQGHMGLASVEKTGLASLLTGPVNMVTDMHIEGLTYWGGGTVTAIKFYSSYSQYLVLFLLNFCTMIPHNPQFLIKFCQCYNVIISSC